MRWVIAIVGLCTTGVIGYCYKEVLKPSFDKDHIEATGIIITLLLCLCVWISTIVYDFAYNRGRKFEQRYSGKLGEIFEDLEYKLTGQGQVNDRK
mgnify:CR=1 FL=1